MKARMSCTVIVVALMTSLCTSDAFASSNQRNWATAGKVLAGVAAVGIVASLLSRNRDRGTSSEYESERSYVAYPRSYDGYAYAAPAPVVREVVYVQQPVTVSRAVSVSPVRRVAAVSSDSFTVNVPNRMGGYTAVSVARSGSGYVGPQGEYYETFPSVAQLQAMYGN